MSAAVMLAALLLELALGWPDGLYRRIRHPVVWIGWLIRRFEQRWNRPEFRWRVRYLLGMVTTVLVVAVAALCGGLIQAALPQGWPGIVLGALVASSLLAARSLHVHVQPIAVALTRGDVEGARSAVGRLVSRDPEQLDEAAIARAGLESLAENTSDGVVAPLFWGVLFGLPGLAAYKAVNTLDSMIGHRTPALEAFGGFAARLDDAANLLPARLTAGLFIAVAGGARGSALRVTRADAHRHRSPNAGWPEAALAGALGIRLSGPRVYAGKRHDEPWLNADGIEPTADHVERGLALYRHVLGGVALLLVIVVALQVAR